MSDVRGVNKATKAVRATARFEDDVDMRLRHIDREVRRGRMFHWPPALPGPATTLLKP
jgi:hypothetical protein